MKAILAKWFYLVWAAAAAAYIYYATSLAPTANRYNLSPTKLRELTLTLVLPIILIWLAAVFGAVRVKSYALLLRGDKGSDGPSMNSIANGLMMLVVTLLESTLGSTYRTLHPEHYAGITIVQNYIQLALLLISFYLIYRGSTGLIRIVKTTAQQIRGLQNSMIPLAFLSVIYGFLLRGGHYRNATPDPTLHASFFLPDWLILLTIALPYVLVWVMGTLAAINLRIYLREVKGTIYKAALGSLANGVFGVIVIYIINQFLGTLDLSAWGLGSILLLVYVFILLIAVSFLYIASGAQKLSKIEQVELGK